MKKRFNKKAQTEISLGTILLLILGLVALILIIIGVTTGFGEFFSAWGLIPDDLTKMAMACENYVGLPGDSARLSYCEFREGRIERKKGWYNCRHIHFVVDETLDGVGFPLLECGQNSESNFCISLENEQKESYKNSVLVNSQSCLVWGVDATSP